jgi:hypothetical protein
MNIYKGLLFLHGHLLHEDEISADAANDATMSQADTAQPQLQRTFNALESLLFLGGRPMHPDQPYDREEPFDQLRVSQAGQATAPESRCA